MPLGGGGKLGRHAGFVASYQGGHHSVFPPFRLFWFFDSTVGGHI